MSDIVERLRRKVFKNPQVGAPHERTVEWQAADEIERLRATLNQTRRFALSGEMDTLVSDEIERLREALEELLCEAEDIFVCMADATGIDRHNFPLPFYKARAALGEEK